MPVSVPRAGLDICRCGPGQGLHGQQFDRPLSEGSASSEELAWSAHSDAEGGQDAEEEEGEGAALSPDQFLNFSFKNLELLGERNREMAETLDGLRCEFGKTDPYD
jgi:hypothetical protein